MTADTGAHDHTEREVTVSQPLDAEARSVARLSELLEASHQLERRPRDLKEGCLHDHIPDRPLPLPFFVFLREC